jgi:hypothetical protein
MRRAKAQTRMCFRCRVRAEGSANTMSPFLHESLKLANKPNDGRDRGALANPIMATRKKVRASYAVPDAADGHGWEIWWRGHGVNTKTITSQQNNAPVVRHDTSDALCIRIEDGVVVQRVRYRSRVCSARLASLNSWCSGFDSLRCSGVASRFAAG